MPSQTDTSGAPYFDDFNESKNFHKILFRPSVAVQTRELNQLQTMLQNQIERFGDNIYKQGTIIDGCNFSYHKSVPYIKIKDTETDGTRVLVENYNGYYVKNSANLISEIAEVASGFQTTTNTNTLFVNYLNSGSDLNTYSYSADDILTIYNKSGTLEDINIIDGSVGFSNNDSVIVLSAIAITNTTGGVTFSNSFSVGDIVTDAVSANVEVVEVDTSSDPEAIILRIKPLSTNLVSPVANADMWTLTSNVSFTANNGESGIVSRVIGANAEATLVTSAIGTVSNIVVTNKGSGYVTDPTISIMSATATSGQVDNLNLEPQSYIARVSVLPASAVPVGTGYGVSVDQGIIYQKGYFIRVDPQFLIVERYGSPDDKIVGFETLEEVINSNIDTSLLDNVLGTSNETAPGANRLKLVPTLVVQSKTDAESDPQFLAIIEFSNGQPYIQRKQTQYNVVNDEIARRMHEADGNFVLDQFLLNTASENTFADEANSFVAVIDPGTAYINGYRVSTDASYNLSINKATETVTSGVTASMNYGSYIKVKELGGSFKFKTGDQIALYDGQKQYVRLTPGEAITNPSSNLIGYARIRSITHDSGVPGIRSAVYRLYLFDIQMNSGKNFTDVRSVFYDGTNKAVADIVTEVDPLNSRVICKLYDSKLSALVFKNGVTASKTISSDSYVYRTIDETLTANSTGYITFNTGTDEVFPYPSGSLSTLQEKDIIVTPLANGTASANLSGSISVYSVNTSVVGTSTTFLSELIPGDWIKVANSTANAIVQIASVANNTFATLTANSSANISSNGILYFPMNIPISLEPTARYANVSASANQMTIFIGSALDADMDVSVVYNVKSSASQVDKTVKRDSFIRLKLSNNESTTIGPWALGVPDVFRLKSVHVANGAANTLSINAVSDVANSTDFVSYVDHRFSNGDSVTYVGGSYVIPGLANNTLYYVFEANTSGFKLSSDNTVALAINSIATNDISHTFTGSPLYFGNTTAGVTDITNDFYIDHNQTENYYNTSYLYQIPSPSTALTNNDILLVQFDVFTHAADAGIKHIESYNIDDTLTLENSNSTINTLEIPQLYSVQDTYYDLRDSVDVRPHVISTANAAANTLTTYTINPTEPAANSKFSGTDKKFPAPESSFVANIEYYVGRVDRVIVDSNGDIRSIAGEAGTDNIAIEPINSLTINVLKIPPYPSYPLSLSTETIKFADTKIANEKYLFKRLQDYRIKTSFSSNDIREEQPRVYRMNDIGTLERRISDLEYYVALTMAESNIKNKVIPSSIDASLERFKYGFFVDSFDSNIYSDIDHPEYNAAVVQGDLVPNFNELNLEFKFNTANSSISSMVRGGKAFVSSYEEYTLINQPTATDGAVVSTPNTTVTYTQKLVSVDVINRTTGYSSLGTAYEDWAFTFSNTAYSPVELFMNCTDNDTAVVVFQSTSSTYNDQTVTTTSQYATPNLKNTSYVQKGGKAYLVGNRSRWENDTGFRSGGPALAGSLWIEDSYRMSWNHDPTKGRYYIIRVYKGSHLVTPSNDAPRGTYAFRLWYPVDDESGKTTAITVSQPTNFQYQGTCILSNNRTHALKMSYGLKSHSALSASTLSSSPVISNVLGIEADFYGLRPNTLHKIYLDNHDYTSTTILREIDGYTDITSWLSTYPSSIPANHLATDGRGRLRVVIFKPVTAGNSQMTYNNQLVDSLKNMSQIVACSTDISPSTMLINKNSYNLARSFSYASIQAKKYINNDFINISGIKIPYSTLSINVS